jgi:hypothetical protein
MTLTFEGASNSIVVNAVQNLKLPNLIAVIDVGTTSLPLTTAEQSIAAGWIALQDASGAGLPLAA